MGVIEASASQAIDAPVERCFEVAADLEHISEWQNGVEEVKVLEEGAGGRPSSIEITNHAKIRTITATVDFSYDEPRGLSWKQTKGDLKSVEGSWTFKDLGDGRTEATYGLRVDPGRMLGMLVRGPVEDQLKEMLVNQRPAELAKRVAG